MRPAIVLALFTLLGCRGAATDATQTPVVPAIAGSYALAAVGGAPLPVKDASGQSITSSRLVVVAAGTWTETRSSNAAGKIENITYFGTWTQSGSDLAFRVGPTTFYTGVTTSSGLRLDSGGAIFTYSRE